MNKCPYCGSVIQENARFCLYCMEPLQKKKKIAAPAGKLKPAVLSAFAAAAVAVAVLTVFGVRSGARSPQPETPSKNAQICDPLTLSGPAAQLAERRASAQVGSAASDPQTAGADTGNAGAVPETEPAPLKTEPGTTAETPVPTPDEKAGTCAVLSAEQIRELMFYEMSELYGDAERVSDHLSAEPSYSADGWEGFRMERVINGVPECFGDPVIYILNENEKSAFSGMEETFSNDDNGSGTFSAMYGTLCSALGVYGDGSNAPDVLLAVKAGFDGAAGSKLWRTTRYVPGCEARTAPEGWRGLMRENGLPDRMGDVMSRYGMTADHVLWTFVLPGAERNIKVTFELREWRGQNEARYTDGAFLLEYDG